MIFSKTIIFGILLFSLMGCSTSEKVSSLDPKMASELETFLDKVEKLEENGAQYISPSHYKSVRDTYKEAYDMAYAGESLERVKKTLLSGENLFDDINENFDLAKVHMVEVIEAREEALEEGSAPLDSFKEADEELVDLGSSLEGRDLNLVLAKKNRVRQMFIEAEVEAIRLREMKKVVENFERAQEMISHMHFSNEEGQALKDIKYANRMISEFKDTPNRYISAVKSAEKSTARFLSLSMTADWVESKNTRELVLALDQDLGTALIPLAYEEVGTLTYKEKIQLLIKEAQYVPFILDELTATQYDSYMQQRRLRKLEQKNERISHKLATKRAARKKLEVIRQMFTEDEAKVLIQGDDLIIRLVGLNFAFDKAVLPDGSKEILKKVAKTAETLSYPNMKIIGHADVKGKAIYNQKLSQKRAKSVSDFLVENTKIDEDSTMVNGAGYKKPVSDNKSKTGRKINRRVDIVFNSVVN